jgi:hypothetical protein
MSGMVNPTHGEVNGYDSLMTQKLEYYDKRKKQGRE